ncbi:putative DNA binding domain-containing protein [Tessaracoccus sp. MC1627]|uniref:RNA-binding domain-containing protein n=1 Tax=Tessaracoccus sp. MC1627 TaxID=2760312 RepID=UPI0016016CB1|nr:RNA-binding domain-containing protein [Tessaracoccus sp. MC1627]MBB1514263.1 putative DNA binding domain-containing protein [Tessaracoccus sp. MC1627]
MTLTNDELTDLLDRLLAGWENEVVEFKEAARQFSADKTGEYVSALSNEANLRGLTSGWLVFGVSNARQVVGTTHLIDVQQRQTLKHHIHQSIDQGLTVREVYEVMHSGKRVVLLEVPAAPRGIPISWKGDYRARAGESLVSLSLDKLDQIRHQSISTDWTAVPLPDATLDHLDPEAVLRARQGFAERYPRLAEELTDWDDATFLSKIRLIIDGQITRAAVILLGKFTSSHLLSPHMAEMSWKLSGPESAYQHFGLPFLLNASALASRIRNIQLRLMPPNELIYREISKYDERSLLEAIYNCIAHQDYSRMSRIIVIERLDRVEFISVGQFFDRSPEDYMVNELVPRGYRNPVLVEAMTELNLIDHMGNGIHRMVQDQVRRFLPLPDYDLSDPEEVKLTIHGAVIDEAFSRVLMVRTDLSLSDILALDRVQKGLPIIDEAIARLRKAKLVEGRRPHLRVNADIAAIIDSKAEYIRRRAQDDAHYSRLVIDYLTQYSGASRKEIDDLLGKYLPEALDPKQQRAKVTNLLTRMRTEGTIRNAGSQQKPRWELV